MEVVGRKSGKSLYLGSDEVQDFPCSPCAKENKTVAAVKHCVECDENLCKTCLDHHNKFSVMKGHQLLDTVISSSGQRRELPSQRCDRHGGKLIDVYCPGHDKVGCSTCIAIEHSTCQGLTFIPDIANKLRSSDELQLLETAINNLQSRFLTLKQKKQNDLENLKQEKDRLLQEIRLERKKINAKLDEMEKELLNEVGSSYQEKLHSINADIKKVGNTIDSLRKDLHKIQAAKSENASEKYVQVKLGNEKKEIAMERLQDMERPSIAERVWFNNCNEIISSKSNIIGRIMNYSAVEVEGSFGEYTVRTNDDRNVCMITDMCIDPDGNVIMTDYNNKRIKKANQSYSVTSCLTVKDNPFGICNIDTSLLAVTLINKKEVQFISMKEPMTLEKSFAVGDRCRGIAYNDGMIYVCCGGSDWREGVGRIEVLTIHGTLVKSYFNEVGYPKYVNAPNWTTEIYVVDGRDKHLVVNRDGNVGQILGEKANLLGSEGICWLNRCQMCIVGYASRNIVLMSCDGKKHEELLTVKDKGKAFSVCFNEGQSKLVVSAYKSDQIRVYKLNISDC